MRSVLWAIQTPPSLPLVRGGVVGSLPWNGRSKRQPKIGAVGRGEKPVVKSLRAYLDQVTAMLAEIPEDELAELVDLFWDCYQRGARLVICGNGGSAATASHLVADFQKNVYLAGGRPWEVIALTDSTPLITAWSNDTEYANVFAGQARCWVRPGDLLVAISGSGNSPNVVAAVEAANEIGATTVALAGYGGGKLAQVARRAIALKSRNMQHVEDAHLIIGHAVYCEIRDRLLEESAHAAAPPRNGARKNGASAGGKAPKQSASRAL